MRLDEIRAAVDEVRKRSESPVFLMHKDKYLCILWPTIKDKANTPHTREKNRRLI